MSIGGIKYAVFPDISAALAVYILMAFSITRLYDSLLLFSHQDFLTDNFRPSLHNRIVMHYKLCWIFW